MTWSSYIFNYVGIALKAFSKTYIDQNTSSFLKLRHRVTFSPHNKSYHCNFLFIFTQWILFQTYLKINPLLICSPLGNKFIFSPLRKIKRHSQEAFDNNEYGLMMKTVTTIFSKQFDIQQPSLLFYNHFHGHNIHFV